MSQETCNNLSNTTLLGEGVTFMDPFLRYDINAFWKDGRTVLSYACEHGNLDIIKYLVQIGAVCTVKDSDGAIPLHIATKHGHVDIVELFHNLGVPLDSCSDNNYTPLHCAAQRGHIKVAKFLIKNNADLNVKTLLHGYTPLLIATMHRKTSVIELLINSVANIFCYDDHECTVLHYACDEGWIKVVEALINIRCDRVTSFWKMGLLRASKHIIIEV